MKLIYFWKPLLECKIVTNRCVCAWKCENKSALRVHVDFTEIRHFARTTCHSTLAYQKAKRWACHDNYLRRLNYDVPTDSYLGLFLHSKHLLFGVLKKLTESTLMPSERSHANEGFKGITFNPEKRVSRGIHATRRAFLKRLFTAECRVNLFHFRNDINSIPRKPNLAPQLTYDVSRLDSHPSRWSNSRADQMKFAEFCSPLRGFSSQAF